jgi:hypothetical protein
MKDVRSEKAAHGSLAHADQGRDQSRPTVSLRPSDDAKSTPILRPSGARITLADHSLRRGTACCARCDAANRRYPLADAHSKPGILPLRLLSATLCTAPVATIRADFAQFSDISTRFCPKSRSHTKHATKPRLPGSRIAHFASSRPEQLRRRTVQRDAYWRARTSTANALSNREHRLLERTLTHRKQTIAPRSNRELSTNPVTLTLASTWHKMTGNQ